MVKVHVIPLGMVNAYILEEDGYILVDTGVAKAAARS